MKETGSVTGHAVYPHRYKMTRAEIVERGGEDFVNSILGSDAQEQGLVERLRDRTMLAFHERPGSPPGNQTRPDADCQEAADLITMLTTALEFYADPTLWVFIGGSSKAWSDRGCIARTALGMD